MRKNPTGVDNIKGIESFLKFALVMVEYLKVYGDDMTSQLDVYPKTK